MPLAEQFDEVLAFLRHSRQTHIEWIEHLAACSFCREREQSYVGDAAHHQECVDGYDKTLALLNALLAKLAEYEAPAS